MQGGPEPGAADDWFKRDDDWFKREAANDEPSETELLSLSRPQAVPASRQEKHGARRGHAFSYAGLFLFTFVLYFRPYELFSALSSLTSLAFWIAVGTLVIFFPSQLALEGTLTTRPREVTLVLLLCLAGLLSIPLALDPGESWSIFVEFLKVAVMFIVMVNVARTERRLKGLIFLALAVACVVSVGVINDYHLGRLRVGGERVGGIIGGMFDNPNELALHLVIMTPIAIGLLLGARGGIRKMLYGACVILMAVANVLTFSRGGFLGLICAVGVLLWKVGRQHRLAVALLAVVMFGLVFALMPGAMVDRFASVFDPSSDESGGASAISRRDILYGSIIVAARHPLLGIGMGNFHLVSAQNLVTHNAYTQVASEIGIPAMLCYVLLIVTPLKRLRLIERREFETRKTSRSYYPAIAFQAGLVGYLVSSFFDSVAYHYYLYYLVGYALCLYRLSGGIWDMKPKPVTRKGESLPAMIDDESRNAPRLEATGRGSRS
jgi:O-antigen ligase